MLLIFRSATTIRWLVAFFVAASLTCAPVFAGGKVGREVLIYYANENAPTGADLKNYETILGWLRAGGGKAASVAETLDKDRRIQPALVDVDLGDLKFAVPLCENGPQAALFSNQLVRAGKCLVWKRGWKEFQELPFPAPQDSHFILASQPLSRAKTMRDVLDLVAEQFDPREHRFILNTKSHGSPSKTITPRLIVRAEETSQEELVRLANRSAEAEVPGWAGKLGISKPEYLAILREAGERRGMQFSLVFHEACDAYNEEFHPDLLPGNVERLMVPKRGNFLNIIYANVFQDLGKNELLADAMTKNLPSNLVVLRKGDTFPPSTSPTRWIPIWVYFVPLAAWLGWLIWLWAKKSRGVPPPKHDSGQHPC